MAAARATRKTRRARRPRTSAAHPRTGQQLPSCPRSGKRAGRKRLEFIAPPSQTAGHFQDLRPAPTLASASASATIIWRSAHRAARPRQGRAPFIDAGDLGPQQRRRLLLQRLHSRHTARPATRRGEPERVSPLDVPLAARLHRRDVRAPVARPGRTAAMQPTAALARQRMPPASSAPPCPCTA